MCVRHFYRERDGERKRSQILLGVLFISDSQCKVPLQLISPLMFLSDPPKGFPLILLSRCLCVCVRWGVIVDWGLFDAESQQEWKWERGRGKWECRASNAQRHLLRFKTQWAHGESILRHQAHITKSYCRQFNVTSQDNLFHPNSNAASSARMNWIALR